MSATVTIKLSPKDYKAIVLATRILLKVAKYVEHPRDEPFLQTPEKFVDSLVTTLKHEIDPSKRGINILALKRHITAVLNELGAS